jgi:hypothetical protein
MIDQRKLTIAQLGHLYERMQCENSALCWYCSTDKECIDHCPPLAILPNLDIDKFRNEDGKFILIPACHQCNRLLGSKHLFTPIERLFWLLDKYKYLYNKQYKGWTDDEIKEMGYSFQLLISQSIKESNQLIDKVRAIEANICNLKDVGGFIVEPTKQKAPVQKKVKRNGYVLTVDQQKRSARKNLKTSKRQNETGLELFVWTKFVIRKLAKF